MGDWQISEDTLREVAAITWRFKGGDPVESHAFADACVREWLERGASSTADVCDLITDVYRRDAA